MTTTTHCESCGMSIETGPWGREVVGRGNGTVRFIGIDGYRWMIRCVANGPDETAERCSRRWTMAATMPAWRITARHQSRAQSA